MNRDVIKYIAIVTMTLNHISNIFMDPDTVLGEAFLDIGYFTAITMCYFLVEGYHYTHSKKKYGQRLLLFALISQVPFQLAVGYFALNMLFTLFLGTGFKRFKGFISFSFAPLIPVFPASIPPCPGSRSTRGGAVSPDTSLLFCILLRNTPPAFRQNTIRQISRTAATTYFPFSFK